VGGEKLGVASSFESGKAAWKQKSFFLRKKTTVRNPQIVVVLLRHPGIPIKQGQTARGRRGSQVVFTMGKQKRNGSSTQAGT